MGRYLFVVILVSTATTFASEGVAQSLLPDEREKLERWLNEKNGAPAKPKDQKPTRPPAEQPQGQKEARGNLTAREVAKRTFPSVVLLAFEQADGKTISQGSGFFVRNDTVITNYHVVAGATRGAAKIVGQDVAYSVAGVGPSPRS